MSPNPNPPFTLTGLISDQNKKPLAGLTVRAFDQDPKTPDNPLGKPAKTNKKGEYAIKFTEKDFKIGGRESGGPDVFITVHDGKKLLGQSAVSRNSKKTIRIDLQIKTEQQSTEANKVFGNVLDGTGKPVNNVLVVAYDRDLRRPEELGRARTTDGHYEIFYKPEQYLRAEKGSADLIVMAYDDKETELASSEIYFNAPPSQMINLTVKLPGANPKTEWDTINHEVGPLLIGQQRIDGGKLGESYRNLLPQELKSEDWEFLNKDTGHEVGHLRFWSLAFLLELEVDNISAEIFYGWFRMELPTALKPLLEIATEQLLSALKRAGEQNIIRTGDEKWFLNIRRQIEAQKAHLILSPAAKEAAPSLGDKLRAFGDNWLSKDYMQKIALHGPLNPDSNFKEDLKTLGLPESVHRKLEQNLRLDKLTKGNPAMMQSLYEKIASDENGDLKGLAEVSSGEWLSLAYQHSDVDQSNEAKQNYASRMEAEVERLHPTETLKAQISRGEIFYGRGDVGRIAAAMKSTEDFDIQKSDLTKFASTNDLSQNQVRLLKSFRELKAVDLQWKDMEPFIDAGIDSVRKVANYNGSQLARAMGLETLDVKDRLDDAAGKANALVANKLGLYFIGPMLTAEIGSLPGAPAFTPGPEPTIRNLFGPLEQCACDPCLSVLSPGAYYVDLLKYLEPASLVRSELNRRRPDLYDLEISCENASIELPYIDLVLEILENAVVFPFQVPVGHGVNWSAQLNATPIGSDVFNLLQRTAEEQIGPLQMESTSLLAGVRTTIIKDSFRRWIIESKDELLGSDEDISFGRGAQFASDEVYKQLIDWLNGNGNKPKSAAASLVEGILLRQVRAACSLKTIIQPWIVDYHLVKSIDSSHWELEFTAEFIVTVDKANQLVRFFSSDRSSSMNQITDPALCDAIINSLKGSKLPFSFCLATIATTGKKTQSAYKVKTVENSPGDWTVSLVFGKFELCYQAPGFQIRGLSYQSTARDRDLITRPQNRNPLAYEKLRDVQSVFPWSLPYDQDLTETRMLALKAGTNLRTLLEIRYSKSAAFEREDWCDEILGLAPSQRGIIVNGTSGSGVFTNWGLKPDGSNFKVFDTFIDQEKRGTGVQLLSPASTLMQQARITFAELQALHNSDYINSDSPRVILTMDSNCQPDLTTLSVTSAFLDRMHRFVRLWRQTKLSVPELTDMIMAPNLGNGTLGPDLKKLAQVIFFSDTYGVTPAVAIGLFAPFTDKPIVSFSKNGKRVEQPGLYNQIFQNKLLQTSSDLEFGKFVPTSSTPPIYTHTKTLNELSAPIALSLGISEATLEFLVTRYLPYLTTSNLYDLPAALQTVQAVWRHVTLMNVLNISPDEYSAAVKLLAPVDLFETPVSLLRFCDDVRFVQSAGVSFDMLEKLLKQANDGEVFSDDDVDAVITSIIEKLKGTPDCIDRDVALIEFDNHEFDLPADDMARWTKWGLANSGSGPNWTVSNPYAASPAVLTDLPLELLKDVKVLTTQCTALRGSAFPTSSVMQSLDQITKLLGAPGAITVVSGAHSTLNGLEVMHLDILQRFIAILSKSKMDIETLGTFMMSVLGTIKSAADIDFEKLKEASRIIRQKKSEVTQLISSVASIEFSVTENYLSEKLTVGPNHFAAMDYANSVSFWQGPSAHGLLIKLLKISRFNISWKATPRQLSWLGKGAKMIWQGIDPDQLLSATTFDDWKKTTTLLKFAPQFAGMQETISSYRDSIKDVASWAEVGDARQVLADYFNVTLEDVNGSAAAHGMSRYQSTAPQPIGAQQKDDQKDPLKLIELIAQLVVLNKYKLKSAELDQLTAPSPSRLTKARQLVKTQFGSDSATALREVKDPLRSIQRDKLVDYLCWEMDERNADALYAYYLIDVQMEPAMRTTRLLQDTASVQLFVNRYFMNLELANVAGDLLDRPRWEWTRNYRVWEANRKVFLYPENWLFPELRDDRTEAFKNSQNLLTQNEPSDRGARDAFINYTESTVNLSKIIVMGMHEYIKDGTRRLIQVGRTLNASYSFYWRIVNFKNNVTWTGWSKIEQDLSPHHIVPFTIDGEIHIAWPVINENNNGYMIDISWIKLNGNSWTEVKKSSSPTPPITKLINRDLKSQFLLRLNESVPQSNQTSFATIDIFVASVPTVLTPILPAITKCIPTSSHLFPAGYVTFNVKTWRKFDSGRLEDQQIGFYFIERIFANNQNESTWDFVTDWPNSWSPPFQGKKTIRITKSNPNNDDCFEIVFQAQSDDSGHPTYTVKQPISINLSLGYAIDIEVVFPGGPDSQPVESPDQSVDMTPVSAFTFEDNNDGYWKDSTATILKKIPGTLFYSSGLLEQVPASRVELFNSFVPFTKSIAQERYFAVRASKSIELLNTGQSLQICLWNIDEGASKMLVEADLNSGKVNRIFPEGFSESRDIMKNARRDVAKVFVFQTDVGFVEHSFGIDKIGPDYNYSGLIRRNDDTFFPFSSDKPNSLINWELYYHLPMMVSGFLSGQQKFEDARRWFHYIFDPTSIDSLTSATKAWRFRPFRDQTYHSIQQLLQTLADPNGDPVIKTEVRSQISEWQEDPFNPFAIARLRNSAFAWSTVIQYIKNLIAWGDQMFRRDTRESINEAALLYIMASDILGRRPEPMGSSRATALAKSYREISESPNKLDDFSNYWIDEQNSNQASPPSSTQITHQLGSLGYTYFCIPPNEKLPELWDTVADRLFKIRHSQNFDGVVRDLPLLDPPIDPELLIRAKAAGLNIPDVIGGLYAPIGQFRFATTLQKSMELVNEVKSLGSAFLSAIEKKEGERLSLLRSGQEIEMLKLVEQIKKEQIDEAKANVESLNKTRANIIARVSYLQRQLGSKEMHLDATGTPIIEQAYMTSVQETGAPDDFRSLALIQSEIDQVWRLQDGHIATMVGAISKITGAALKTAAAAFGVEPTGAASRPINFFAEAAYYTGEASSLFASNASFWERRAGMIAGWQRRRDEWIFQAKSAIAEIKQLDKQIIASEIRVAIAEKELQNHKTQIEHTQRLDEYVRNQKFTNETLYQWMETQLSSVYFTTYQFALDQAQKAERAFRFELGIENSNYIRPGAWDSLKKGLLAGESLSNDLRRLELAYLERNKREFEITKHISLAQLDPVALLNLRINGKCDFSIPEALFDIDFSGHYFRRVKSISISMPCIAGPYTSVSSTLTLLSSKVRTKQTIQGTGYTDTENYSSSYVPVSKSITTSNAQNDSGVFELNFRDERYLPFEGAGVISDWRLELPSEFRQFNYDSIADVVVHMKYTARKEARLVDASETSLRNRLAAIQQNLRVDGKGLYSLFSLKHDMPNEWNLLKSGKPATIRIDESRLPYLFLALKGNSPASVEISFVSTRAFNLVFDSKAVSFQAPSNGLSIVRMLDTQGNGLKFQLGTNYRLEENPTSGKLSVLSTPEDDIILLVRYW